ncbi:hypothetical protein [Aliarcobacter cryaerophilus]|uniref:hypothetical protein n=1 Tax=Aliarcobacter cryaerophilus TaxID=28198 RepID=UPI0021B17CBD|nr:hypothetical protein [Aliarcobacter cryaerophilus]MCT7513671.1 hypothetical protein [Aliarcobacter cryaerophilus]
MGGNSSKVIDPVGATIASVTGNRFINKTQDLMSQIIDPFGNRLEKEIKFFGDTAKAVDGFWDNVHIGAHRDTGNMIKGIYTGDWSMFKDSFLSLGTAALYAIGGVAGAMTGQAWLVAAAVVALDGHYNQSQLTSHAVTQVGELEKDIFGSSYILDNVDLITAAIVIAGSIYAGGKGFGLLADISGVSSALSSYSQYMEYFKIVSGGYSVYDGYAQWQYALELYDKLMSDYKSWVMQATMEHVAFNKMWDAVYGDLNVWYEAMPGGYLFNAGVGSDEYSISSINEQSAYCLALNTKRDVDFDRYFTNPFEIDYVGLNIDDIKPEDLKYKD